MAAIVVWDSKMGWKLKAVLDHPFDLQVVTEEREGWKVVASCRRVIVMFQRLGVWDSKMG